MEGRTGTLEKWRCYKILSLSDYQGQQAFFGVRVECNTVLFRAKTRNDYRAKVLPLELSSRVSDLMKFLHAKNRTDKDCLVWRVITPPSYNHMCLFNQCDYHLRPYSSSASLRRKGKQYFFSQMPFLPTSNYTHAHCAARVDTFAADF